MEHKAKQKSSGGKRLCKKRAGDQHRFQALSLGPSQGADTSVQHLQPSITLPFHIFISDILKTQKGSEEETERGSALTIPVLF